MIAESDSQPHGLDAHASTVVGAVDIPIETISRSPHTEKRIAEEGGEDRRER